MVTVVGVLLKRRESCFNIWASHRALGTWCRHGPVAKTLETSVSGPHSLPNCHQSGQASLFSSQPSKTSHNCTISLNPAAAEPQNRVDQCAVELVQSHWRLNKSSVHVKRSWAGLGGERIALAATIATDTMQRGLAFSSAASSSRTASLRAPGVRPARAAASRLVVQARQYEAGVGIFGTKAGMMTYFTPEGSAVPATVIALEEGNIVTMVKSQDTDGYAAVQVGYKVVPERKVKWPEMGHLKKSGCPPMKHLREFKVCGQLQGHRCWVLLPLLSRVLPLLPAAQSMQKQAKKKSYNALMIQDQPGAILPAQQRRALLSSHPPLHLLPNNTCHGCAVC